VDSVNGGLWVRFDEVPDAPLTKLIVTAQGAKKGLFQNSTNICKGTHRATLKLDAQSGKVHDSQPKMVAQCKGKAKKARAKAAPATSTDRPAPKSFPAEVIPVHRANEDRRQQSCKSTEGGRWARPCSSSP